MSCNMVHTPKSTRESQLSLTGEGEEEESKFIALVKKIMKTMNFKTNNKIPCFIKTFLQWERVYMCVMQEF